MLTLVLMLLSQNGCQPGGNCQAASFYPTCTAGAAFPACTTAQRGRIRCALDGLDGGSGVCQAFCDGSAWACVGSGGGGGTYTGTAPITVTGSAIGCTPASSSVGGCLTKVSTGSGQTIGGIHTWTEPNYYQGSSFFQEDIWLGSPFGGTIRSLEADRSTQIGGNKNSGSTGADVRLFSQQARASTDTLVSIGEVSGDTFRFGAGGDLVSYGDGTTDYPSFVDQSCVSSHVSMSSCDGYLLTFQGGLSAQRQRWFEDGGFNFFDGGSITNGDGGRWYPPFAALHGNIEANVKEPQYAGWLQAWVNTGKPAGTPQNSNAVNLATSFIDYRGGYGIYGPLNRDQFDTAAYVVYMNPDNSPWVYGQLESTMQYAHDTSRWYFQGKPDASYVYPNVPDAGNWKQFAIREDVVGNVCGFFPGGTNINDNWTVVTQRMYGEQNAAWQRLSWTAQTPGTGGGTFTVDIYDNTTSTVLCTSSATACNTSPISSKDCAAVTTAQYTDIRLRTHMSGCTTSPSLNLCAEYQ